MSRLHLHLKTADLDASIRFYTALFGRTPDRRKADYAKWALENPRANIALSTQDQAAGDSAAHTAIDHTGIEVESTAALETIAARLEQTGATLMPEKAAHCCYAKGDKYWARSPEGTMWELFHTTAAADTYGAGINSADQLPAACCAP